MPLITEFCRLGACERCTNPACTHSCHIVLVLAFPPCSICWDQDAVCETIAWGCRADLCAACAERYGDPGSRRELRARPAELPLPTEREAGAYVEFQEWKRARPLFRGRRQAKHEYVLLRRSTDPFMQLRVLAMIREHGGRRRYGSSYHRYWVG